MKWKKEQIYLRLFLHPIQPVLIIQVSTNCGKFILIASCSEPDSVDTLRKKLEAGIELSKEEEKEIKQFVQSLNVSAAQLIIVANEFEALLKKNTSS